MKNEGTILNCTLTVWEPKRENLKQYVKLDTPWQGMGFTNENVEKVCDWYHLKNLVPMYRDEEGDYTVNKFSCNMRVY